MKEISVEDRIEHIWKKLIEFPPISPILYAETSRFQPEENGCSHLFVKTAAVQEDDHVFYSTIQYTTRWIRGSKHAELVGKIAFMTNYGDNLDKGPITHNFSSFRFTLEELEKHLLTMEGYETMEDYNKDHPQGDCQS